MEDLIMKKLIMFVMVLAIATPAVAEDLNPAFWRGAPDSTYVNWTFDVEYGEDTIFYPEESVFADEENHNHPDSLWGVEGPGVEALAAFATWGGEIGWIDNHEGRQGVTTPVGEMLGFVNNSPRDLEKFKRMRIQMTYYTTGDPCGVFVEMETACAPWDGEGWNWWPRQLWVDWAGFVVTPLGGDWYHVTMEVDTQYDTGTEDFTLNPGAEVFFIGGGINIDQVVFDSICYSTAEPPEGADPSLTVETVDIPVYEPQDLGGPPLPYPNADIGTLKVKLSWQPSAIHDGEPNYIDFNATVVVDPNTNPWGESGKNPDFSFTNPVPPGPDGSVTLTFDQDDWDVFKDVTVKATKDLLREGNENYSVGFTVTIDIDDPNFGSDPCQPCTQTESVIVVDNDIPYISIQQVDPCAPLVGTLSENDPCVSKCVDVRLSHLPTNDVYVFVRRDSEFPVLFESMSVMIPPLGVGDDPNRLIFTTGNYGSLQTICLQARDDDIRGEGPEDAGLEWVPGEILFNALSDDPRYQSVEEGGELEETSIPFNVQDNECGALGYLYTDFNQDCVVDLADFTHFYEQWALCTQPYPSDPCEVCDKLWNLFEE